MDHAYFSYSFYCLSFPPHLHFSVVMTIIDIIVNMFFILTAVHTAIQTLFTYEPTCAAATNSNHEIHIMLLQEWKRQTFYHIILLGNFTISLIDYIIVLFYNVPSFQIAISLLKCTTLIRLVISQLNCFQQILLSEVLTIQYVIAVCYSTACI